MSGYPLVSDEEASGSSERKRVAMDSNLKSIAKEATAEIDGERLEDLVNIQPNVKIVILKNYKSLSAIVNTEFLRNVENTQIFVIVIRLSETYDKSQLRNMSDKIATPTILQIDNAGSRRLFFTNIEKQFEEVKIDDSHDERLSPHFNFNFVCNLLYSEPEKFGKFSFKITEMEIDPNACFEGKRLIDLAVENGDLLTLKFLMLFQPDIEALNGDKKRILEILVGNGNLELLKAVLEIPDRAVNFEAHLSAEKRSALNLLSEDDLSLLMIAARSGKNDVIKFLLKCGLNVNCLNRDKQTACDFAWDNGNFNSVTELVDADSPFPYDFDLDQVSAGSELEKMSEERDTLHEQIQNNQIDEVKKFVEQNPKIKCAYDNRNQSALVTALESKNFEIYSFLRSKGFSSGIDGDDKKILSDLTFHEKDELKLSNRKYFPMNEYGHIMDLLSRSRLGFESEQKNFEKIAKYYEALDAIPEVRPILQVISMAKTLDIVFDFNQESIADMDPTQNFKHTVVKGRTIYNNGNILIGAKSSDAEVLATMAHEFTHYALHLVYDNLGHPYHADGFNRKKEFAKIVDVCEAKKLLNPIIENVFTYDPKEHAVELIVRVPQLFALHCQDPNTITKICEDFGKLFGFFTDRVLCEFEQEIPVMKAKEAIRNVNKISELKKEAEASKFSCDNRKIDFDEIVYNSENILILSSVPNLVLCNLLNDFKKNATRNVDSLHIFIKLQQLMDPKHGEMIREAFESNATPKLFVLETKEVIQYAEIKKFYNYPIMSSKVVLIAKSVSVEKEDEENFENVFPIQHQIEYKWSDLNETSRSKILTSKVQFQGLEMPLSDLLTADSEIFKELPLEEVLKLSEMKLKTVDESVPSGSEIYIERTFQDASNAAADSLTTDDVIELLILKKSLILADDSGMGKTTTALHLFRKLRQLYPHSWVVHIDLKQHTDSFYKDDDVSLGDITSEFFSAKILQFEATVEKKFFEHFYVNGKVIFILDGFDEICPDYKNCVLKVVENIQKSKNVLLVTTRTHLQQKLEEKMSSRIIKLHQFSIDDQVEFLVKFWRSNKRPEDELETKARSLLKKFRKKDLEFDLTCEDFFVIPLHVRMLAEIYEKSEPTEKEIQELNVCSLYRSFIEKKIDIFVEKGPLGKRDSSIVQKSRSLNIWEIHQKLALEMFFTEDITEAMELPEIEEPLTDELLARIGLVRVEGSQKLMFMHLSISEYFVADFVLSNVTKKTLLAKSDELHQMFLQTLGNRDKMIFFRGNQEYDKKENVRMFMNAKLQMKENLNVDVLSAKLEKSLQEESNRTFLQTLVKEKLEALVTFMLTTIKISKALKVSLIIQKENGFGNNTAFLSAAIYSSLSSFKLLWSCIESFSNEAERITILFSTNRNKKNALIHAIEGKNLETVQFLLETASSLMDLNAFKKWLMQKMDHDESNALIYASQNFPIAFDLLWEASESKLEPEDQKDLLFCQNKYKLNVLLAAAEHSSEEECQKLIQSILKITKDLFNYPEMKTFLLTEGCWCSTALHSAAEFSNLETFTILWNFIKKELNKSDQKILWKKKNKYGSNIFILSIHSSRFRWNQKTIAKEIISAAKEIFDPEEIWEAFTEKNNRNESFISLAAKNGIVDRIFEPTELERVAREYTAGNNANSIIQNLSDALTDDLSAQDLKAALYAKVEDGDTALHVALQFGSIFLVDRIFRLVDTKLSKSEHLELIQTESLVKNFNKYLDDTSENILRRSGRNVHKEVMDIVCNFLICQTDLVADVKALFTEEMHQDSKDFFSYAASRNRSCLIDVLDWLKKNFSHEDLRKAVFSCDFFSRALVHQVAEFCDASLTRRFLDFCKSSFNSLEMKELILSQSNYDHNNLLGFSLRNASSAVVSVVWNIYATIFNEVQLEELLFKNNQGKRYFDYRLELLRNRKAVETLKVIITARYGKDKMLRLIGQPSG